MSKPLRNLTRHLRRPLHRRDALRRLAELHQRPRALGEIVSSSLDLGSRGLFKVKSRQKPSEIQALARAVAQLAPRTIVEIGTDLGGTLLIWSHIARERVIACDLEQPPYRREIYRAFPPPDSSCAVTVLQGNSHSSSFRARVEKELAGAWVDFLFIDGDHTADGVTADYEDYRTLVRPGGLIAFHDILEKQPFPATRVHELWRRLRDEVHVEEFVDNPEQTGFGIGLVRVSA